MQAIKSVAIPPRRELTSPSRRTNLDEPGPTDFTLMRRAELMGESLVCRLDRGGKAEITGNNSGQATGSSLSLLHFHEKITNPQYHAGLVYQGMRRVLFGKAYPKGSHLSKVIATSIFSTLQMREAQRKMEMSDEERDEYFEEIKTMYYRGDNRLRKLPYYNRVRDMVRRVCIDDMMPIRSGHLKVLRTGLQELHGVYDSYRRGK